MRVRAKALDKAKELSAELTALKAEVAALKQQA
jgi:hypothetical protein